MIRPDKTIRPVRFPKLRPAFLVRGSDGMLTIDNRSAQDRTPKDLRILELNASIASMTNELVRREVYGDPHAPDDPPPLDPFARPGTAPRRFGAMTGKLLAGAIALDVFRRRTVTRSRRSGTSDPNE